MLRKATIVALTLSATAGAGLPLLPAQAQDSASITGVAFEDVDRDGVRDAGEPARAGDALYLFDADGSALAAATTDAEGRYTFTGMPSGTYEVRYTTSAWRSIRNDVVPTTSEPLLKPALRVSAPAAGADFGWRRIVRSTTAGAPLSSFTGPDGMVVESYNDVVLAEDVYSVLAAGQTGREASSVTVRLDLSGTTTTSAAVGATNGVYERYSAVCSIAWGAWLDRGASVLAHEYGHAWSLYYAHLVQQDSSLSGYLKARGIAGDPRLGSSSDWYPRELVAEDYRQLLGAPEAQSTPQANHDLPSAAEVPGLLTYLTTTYQAAPSAVESPAPSASPTPQPATSSAPTSPAPSTSPSAGVSPSPSASPSVTSSPPTASPSPSPTASKGAKGGGAPTCRKC